MTFVALLAAIIVSWKVVELREREYADTLATADQLALENAALRITRQLEAALALEDPTFFRRHADEIVQRETGIDGIEISWKNGTSQTAGRGLATSDHKIQRELFETAVSPTVVLLGDAPIGPRERIRSSAAVVTIYGQHPSLLTEVHPVPADFFTGEFPWFLGAFLLLSACAYLVGRRLSRLSAAVVNVVSGDYEAEIEIAGRDEVSWMSNQLVDLREILKEQFERVKDRNEMLQKDLASKNAILQKSAAFSSALVSPLDSSAGLRASALALAAASGAEVILIFRHAATRGVDECIASVGLVDAGAAEALESDGGIAELLRRSDGITRLSALKPNHRWMRAGDRHIPLYGHVGISLSYRDKDQGYLIVAKNQPFDGEAEGLIASAARLLSVAVANYTAYEQARSLTDVLQQKNNQLIEQRDALETANRLQTQFTATISHELRTPLNAIVGYGELLVDEVYGPIETPQREALDGIMQAGSHLLAMVNQVLELSVADAGELSIHMRRVPLHEVVREAIMLVTPLCRNRPYSISADIFEAHLDTDPERVHQILVNLLNNAIKFTEEGSVKISMTRHSSEFIALTVADTGQGIAPSEQQVIFQAFRQAEQGYDRSHDGVGLGLAISQQIAHALGGTIRLESTPGVGSAFTLLLPVSLDTHGPTPPQTPSQTAA